MFIFVIILKKMYLLLFSLFWCDMLFVNIINIIYSRYIYVFPLKIFYSLKKPQKERFSIILLSFFIDNKGLRLG